jgi:hypothetical protein
MIEAISKEKQDRLLYFLKDDKYALLFCLDLLYVSHLWDDLLDLDKVRSGEEINEAFIRSLWRIPSNLFYRQCQPALLPMMYNALCMWLESGTLKKSGENGKLAAFALDNAVVEIIHFCILIKGTIDWAREVGPEFWALFGPTSEDLTECLEAENV